MRSAHIVDIDDGQKFSGAAPILIADESSLLTDKGKILERWAERFNKALNCPSAVYHQAFDEIEQLSTPPSQTEVSKTSSHISTKITA